MSDSTLAPNTIAEEPPAIVPFWQRLNDFFLFPFQMEPLIWAIALALVNAVLVVLPLAFVLRLLVAFATVYYFFKVTALASRGVLHSRDYSQSLIDPDWKWLPVKLYAVIVVGILIAYLLVFVHPLLALLALLIVVFLLPAAVMVLIQSCSLRSALNPMELLTTVTDLGAQYLLLCLFLFLLVTGTGTASWLLASTGIGLLFLLPLLNFVSVYFLWVMAALIGYVMYQHHGALQIEVARQPAGPNAPAADPKTRRASATPMCRPWCATANCPRPWSRRASGCASIPTAWTTRNATCACCSWTTRPPGGWPATRSATCRCCWIKSAASGRCWRFAP